MVQVSSSDLILWNKSISNYDEEMLKYYLCKENLDLLANLQNEIALCAKHNMVSKKEDKVKQLENQGRPNNEQLQKVFNRLREDVSINFVFSFLYYKILLLLNLFFSCLISFPKKWIIVYITRI